jgi:hypothetical protein
MKKVILLIGLLSIAFNSYAGVCNNGSLLGAYNVNGSSLYSGQEIYAVSRINFNGKGTFTISGIAAVSGIAKASNASGTYSVSASCIVAGISILPTGQKTQFWIYLDNIDTAPAINVAYHGSIISNNTTLKYSASGTIDRVIGKF